MKIEEKIKQVMAQRKITNNFVSEKSGVNLRTIENWFTVNKNFNPCLNDFLAVCRVLGLSVDYLISENEESMPESFYSKFSLYTPLLEKINSLNDEDKNVVEKIIDIYAEKNINKNINNIKEIK